jgi:hypothetical protein
MKAWQPAGGRFMAFGTTALIPELPVTHFGHTSFVEERWPSHLKCNPKIDVEEVQLKRASQLKSSYIRSVQKHFHWEVSLKDPETISKEKAAHELLVQGL